MNKNPHILVFTDAEETDRLFAEYDLETSAYVCNKLYDEWFFDDDRASIEGIDYGVQEQVVDNEPHCAEYGPFRFQRLHLNTLSNGTMVIEDPEFKVMKGAKVYEAAMRITMGCDMSYALEPVGYFTRKIESPEFENLEWIERIIF